ncbi:MAG: SPFH domain-containing protein [Vulcanimicrobiota bacterium]
MQSHRILDVLEFSDPTGSNMVHKEPPSGADIQYGAQLVVRETQSAVFYKDGKALTVFGPGRHTLTTNNVPLLKNLISNFTSGGKTPFQAEVYFINTKIFQDLKWGTPNPIDMMDPDLGIVSLRAFGTYSIKVVDPQLFVNTLVGTQGAMDTRAVEKFLKGSILTRFNDLVGEQFKSYFKIRKDFDELSAAMKFKVKEDFEKYGIEIRDFFLRDVSVPEEVQEAFKERAKMGALGDMGKFMQYKTATAIGDMANRPAGGGGDPMNAGMGMGMGMMMPQMMGQAMNNAMGGQQMGQAQPQAQMQQPQAAAPPPATMACPNCQAQIAQGTKFCPNCGQPTAPPKAKCPNCQNEVDLGMKFCPNCGSNMAPPKAQCPKCQNEVPPGTKFCPNCGNQMS